MPKSVNPSGTERPRALRDAILRHFHYTLGKEGDPLDSWDAYMATAYTIRERLLDRMAETEARYARTNAKRLYYFSIEFLIGRSLANNLINLGIYEPCRKALEEMGLNLADVLEAEPDAALGNGGLGRLAACFLDSLATLGMPGFGYGLNYEYGMFKQNIENGYQHEVPDHWQAADSPWLIKRPGETCLIPMYGDVSPRWEDGEFRPHWENYKLVVGQPHDMPMVGFGNRTVNTLRLFSAFSSDEFDMKIFNQGDYVTAVREKIASEIISKVLYPSDSVRSGQELRLIQEYFFVACALRDILRRYVRRQDSLDHFPEQVAIQLNDTHPSLAVVELMRLFMDEYRVPWNKAWELTNATFGYTNHTLLPEALEKWPVSLLEAVLPRHVQIISEINDRFLAKARQLWPGNEAKVQKVSLFVDEGEAKVRMAHLAVVGSHTVNGVSTIHSQLVAKDLFPEFHEIWPDRFISITNGITQRRWLLQANPKLSDLITRSIGPEWITDLNHLRKLEPLAADQGFRDHFAVVKRANKERLAKVMYETTGVSVDPASLFDIQAKRIHEYKRQLLHVMHVVHLYLALVEDGMTLNVPRTHVFAGKAAPGYWNAKQIIKLIHNVGKVINKDPKVKDQLKVVFIPDYKVSLAEIVFPAADLSEQISTAGMEASGTGNMKFALNGALTMGTLDGANIELREEAGEDNLYIFGLTVEEIKALRQKPGFQARESLDRSPLVRRVVNALSSERFCPEEPGIFKWLSPYFLEQGDFYLHMADLESYVHTQRRAATEFLQPGLWVRKAVLNVARIGKFSADRTVREYAKGIWGISGGGE